MQIDKTTPIIASATEVSRQTAAAAAQSRISARQIEIEKGDARDTVQTSQRDLVQMILKEHDRKAETRVAELREQFESGTYSTNSHEVARAILAGVLAGY